MSNNTTQWDPGELELYKKTYPDFSDEELLEAKERLTEYLKIVTKIVENRHRGMSKDLL